MIDFAERLRPRAPDRLDARRRGRPRRSITAAGSVFIGAWSPESAGDYASGTNHTLPTGGWARAYSGVNTDCVPAQDHLSGTHARGASRPSPRRSSPWPRPRASGRTPPPCASGMKGGVLMRPLEELVRPNIRALKPYSTARDEYAGGAHRRRGSTPTKIPTTTASTATPTRTRSGCKQQHRRAERRARRAGLHRQRQRRGHRPRPTASSAVRASTTPFRSPRPTACTASPPTSTTSRCARCRSATDFSLPVERAAGRGGRAHANCCGSARPNNPTGNAFPAAEIERLLRRIRRHGRPRRSLHRLRRRTGIPARGSTNSRT